MTTEYTLTTPVAFIIFNRPDTTARVFAEIAKAKPPKLLVVSDGPRLDRTGEAEKCAAARAIIEQVDWPCQVLTNYSDVNLGCKRRVSSGLDWVFETVEEAIILEDDCLPHPTFFRFCQELLEKYRDDERVMHISGDNFQSGQYTDAYSYYFSRYSHVWGWASWRRAWKRYDRDMRLWTNGSTRDVVLKSFVTRNERIFWKKVWNDVSAGKIDTWDYQWFFACSYHNGVSIMPTYNIVSNIGFRIDATHTIQRTPWADLPTQAIQFPLNHPASVIIDTVKDEHSRKLFFTEPPVLNKIGYRLKHLIFRLQAV